jgi:hypothetical protein
MISALSPARLRRIGRPKWPLKRRQALPLQPAVPSSKCCIWLYNAAPAALSERLYVNKAAMSRSVANPPPTRLASAGCWWTSRSSMMSTNGMLDVARDLTAPLSSEVRYSLRALHGLPGCLVIFPAVRLGPERATSNDAYLICPHSAAGSVLAPSAHRICPILRRTSWAGCERGWNARQERGSKVIEKSMEVPPCCSTAFCVCRNALLLERFDSVQLRTLLFKKAMVFVFESLRILELFWKPGHASSVRRLKNASASGNLMLASSLYPWANRRAVGARPTQ